MSRVSWHLKAYSIVEGEMTDRGTTDFLAGCLHSVDLI